MAQLDSCAASTGYLVAETADFGKGLVTKSTDGGLTWVDQSANVSPTVPDYRLLGVRCLSAATCVVAGDRQSLMDTTDGGDHWMLQNLLTQ